MSVEKKEARKLKKFKKLNKVKNLPMPAEPAKLLDIDADLQEKEKMPIALIIICAVLWFIGFTYPTGFGIAFGIYDKAQFVITISLIIIFIKRYREYRLTVVGIFMGILTLYIVIANRMLHARHMEDYLWIWGLVPIMAYYRINEKQFKWIGLIYGGVSTAVLFIGNITSVFDGWDGNSVSIMQFFSYTVFMAIFADIKDVKNIRYIVIFSVIYLYLISVFECRSVIWFSVVMLLCMLSIIPLRKALNKFTIFLILLIPLIIALFVIYVSKLPVMESLNSWSIDKFGKLIFNGRDTIWQRGMEAWGRHPIIGNGNFNYERFHNSAVTMLVAGGTCGYIILILTTYRILIKTLKWKEDSMIYGLTTAFLVIWMQQSVELGLISTTPNVIPYMILGLIYARIKTLEEKENAEAVNNSTDIQHGDISS